MCLRRFKCFLICLINNGLWCLILPQYVDILWFGFVVGLFCRSCALIARILVRHLQMFGPLALVHQPRQLAGIVAYQQLEITVKLVCETFARYLGYHVAIVVVTQRTGELLVVHGGFVLLLAPQTGNAIGITQLELAVGAHPFYDVGVLAIGEYFQQELPQLHLPVVAGADAVVMAGTLRGWRAFRGCKDEDATLVLSIPY